MKNGTPRHPKIGRLMRALSISRAEAVGLLEMLWQYTADRAPRGDLGRWADSEIADALEWKGEPGALVEGLLASGWLDASSAHRLVVHDWKQHAEDRVHMALARKTETFVDGTLPTMRRLSIKEREDLERRFRAHKKRTRSAPPSVAVAVALPSLSPPLPMPEPTTARATPAADGEPVTAVVVGSGERAELVALRAQGYSLLREIAEAGGGDGQVELLRASRVRGGGHTLTSLEACPSLPWLRVVVDKLTARLLDLRQPGATTPLSPRAQQREDSMRAMVAGGLRDETGGKR